MWREEAEALVTERTGEEEQGEAIDALGLLAHDLQRDDAAPGESAKEKTQRRFGQYLARAFRQRIRRSNITHAAIDEGREGGDLWREEALVAKRTGQEEQLGVGHGLVWIGLRARETEDNKFRIGKAFILLQSGNFRQPTLRYMTLVRPIGVVEQDQGMLR